MYASILKMGSCIFCKIIKGEIPCFKVWGNEEFYAFLSIGPHTPGHTLVIPKKHIDDFFDLDPPLLEKILVFSKVIVSAQKKAFNPKTGKVGLAVAGLEIPHAHLHLIPLHELGDLDFGHERQVSQEVLQKNLDKLKLALKNG